MFGLTREDTIEFVCDSKDFRAFDGGFFSMVFSIDVLTKKLESYTFSIDVLKSCRLFTILLVFLWPIYFDLFHIY